MIKKFIVASLLACASLAQAQSVTVPHTFSSGAPARAAEVNANFAALTSGINALAARVAKLEGQIVAADMAGTYALRGLQVELAGGPGAHVASYVYTGTFTLRADGTGTLVGVQSGNSINIATAPVTRGPANLPSETTNFTWTLNGSTLTTSIFTPTLAVSNGGRMLMAAGASGDDGTNVVLIMTRLN